MTLWLQHQEAIDFHSAYIDWIYHKTESLPFLTDGSIEDIDDQSEAGDDSEDIVPDEEGLVYHIVKTCPLPQQSIDCLTTDFGAVNFLPALTTFLQKNMSQGSFIQLGMMDYFDVYTQVTLQLPPNHYLSSAPLSTQAAHQEIGETLARPDIFNNTKSD